MTPIKTPHEAPSSAGGRTTGRFAPLRTLIAGLMVSVLGAGFIGTVVIAQAQPQQAIEWDKRRLDQLDRNVRRLERALTQRNAAGAPVIIEPDPEVVALQGRVDVLQRRLEDIESSFQRVNQDMERMSFALDEAERSNTQLRRRLDATTERLNTLETRASAIIEANTPVAANSPTGSAAGDYAEAMRFMNQGDFAAARRAFEVFVVTWPDADQTREANYRLGETRLLAEDNSGAVQAYAASLSGWPRTPWAADATVKLATALHADGRTPQACQALNEFRTRYNEGAPQAVRTRATQLRTRAQCA